MSERLNNNRVATKIAAGALAMGAFFSVSSTEAQAVVPEQTTVVHAADKYKTNDELRKQIESVPATLRDILGESEATVSRKLKPGTDDMAKPIEEKLATTVDGKRYVIVHRYDLQKNSGAFETFTVSSADTATGEFLDGTFMIDNELLVATLADRIKKPQVYINTEASVYSADQLTLFANGVRQLIAGIK